MNKMKKIKRLLFAVIAVLSIQVAIKAEAAETYTHFVKSDGSSSTEDPMDAVAAVKTSRANLSGVSYDAKSDILTLNGLQADTLKVYVGKIHLTGTNKITDFYVNTNVESVTADIGSSFSCMNKKGRKADSFFSNLPPDLSGSDTEISKGKITLDKSSAAMFAAGPGNALSLKASITGNGTVVWSSSNANMATVNNGTVTPKKAGVVIITATLINSNQVVIDKATCTVTIKTPTISLNAAAATLYEKGKNSTGGLFARVNGVAVAANTVTWTSSNNSVATVSNGIVSGVKAGTAMITAQANGVQAICKMTIKAPTLSLDKTSATLYTRGAKTVDLVPTINGVKSAASEASWSTSNSKIATVSNGRVTAVAEGSVTITAKANGVSKTCKITVKKPSISVSPKEVTIKKGKIATLTATVRPSNGTVSYSSSKKSVATVDSKGVVKGVAAGTATITASCNGAKATIKVTVTK